MQRVLELMRTDITHIGVQSGSQPEPYSTKLDGEFARKAIVDALIDGNILVLDGFFDETEAIGHITGFGAFGSGATNAIDSGELFAASSADMEKTGADTLTLSAEITVRRVVS